MAWKESSYDSGNCTSWLLLQKGESATYIKYAWPPCISLSIEYPEADEIQWNSIISIGISEVRIDPCCKNHQEYSDEVVRFRWYNITFLHPSFTSHRMLQEPNVALESLYVVWYISQYGIGNCRIMHGTSEWYLEVLRASSVNATFLWLQTYIGHYNQCSIPNHMWFYPSDHIISWDVTEEICPYFW